MAASSSEGEGGYGVLAFSAGQAVLSPTVAAVDFEEELILESTGFDAVDAALVELSGPDEIASLLPEYTLSEEDHRDVGFGEDDLWEEFFEEDGLLVL